MPSGKSVQIAVVIFLVILIIMLMKGYIGVTETVLGITVGLASLVVSTAIDTDEKYGGENVEEPDVPDCCKAGEHCDDEVELCPDSGSNPEEDVRGGGIEDAINFEKVLAQKIKSKRYGKKDRTIYAHQEACREILTALTGQEFHELSASKPKPKGEHIVATKDVLPDWCKEVDGNDVYLDMDGWNAEEKLGFEYRGPVHDQEPKVQANDAIKEGLARDQGIKLMILHYGIPANLMTRYVYTRLVDWKIPMPHGLPKISKLSTEQMSKLDWSHPKRLENMKK